MYSKIETPRPIVDLEVMEKNIIDMIERNKKHNINHRPHIKAHKSIFIANEQIRHGAVGITCAKLSEAEVMISGGIKDIFIAYPLIGEFKLKRLEKILQSAEITTVVNSLEGVNGLAEVGKRIGKDVNILIELDGGLNRGGFKTRESLVEFAKVIKDFKGIKIVGVMYYGGTIYVEKESEGIIKKTAIERESLLEIQKDLKDIGVEVEVLSGGSSFSAQFPEHLEGITEVRAGNYIFNDCSRLSIDQVKEEDCALRVLSMVVSKPDSKTLIIDAGTKSLTSDKSNHPGHGYIVGHPELLIEKLNEEHGFIKSNNDIDLNVGDIIEIIPNHACVIPNLFDEIYGVRNGELEKIISIDARGKSF